METSAPLLETKPPVVRPAVDVRVFASSSKSKSASFAAHCGLWPKKCANASMRKFTSPLTFYATLTWKRETPLPRSPYRLRFAIMRTRRGAARRPRSRNGFCMRHGPVSTRACMGVAYYLRRRSRSGITLSITRRGQGIQVRGAITHGLLTTKA